MEKVAPNSKFVGHSTEIIRQSKIKGPLKKKMVLDLHIKNNAICRSILKKISKLRDQISLRTQLTSVHSKFVGYSNEKAKSKGLYF